MGLLSKGNSTDKTRYSNRYMNVTRFLNTLGVGKRRASPQVCEDHKTTLYCTNYSNDSLPALFNKHPVSLEVGCAV